MYASNRWMIVAAVVGLMIVAALVPLAFILGRTGVLPESTPIASQPTATQVVVEQATATLVVDTPTVLPSLTPLPTNTPLPTATLLPSATPLPTNTPLPTFTPLPTRTPTPSIPCNAAAFVADITVPDGAPFAPGADFEKVWRIKNVGTCTWTNAYTFNYVSGTDMANNKNESVALPGSVKPGETVDIKVKLTAPSKPGVYNANWLLASNTGASFGAGSQATAPFTVKITVLNLDPDVAYDLILQACKAEWVNSKNKTLSCPGTASGTEGFVTILSNPVLENRIENEPALWVNPDHRENGTVTGIFPVYNVKDGDHFLAWIGCLADSKGCNVTFELSYMKGNGNVFSLGKWTETFDGEVTVLDIDLSDLAGQNIQLMLSVRVNNAKPDKANAFWFAPRIVNDQQ